MINIRRQCPKFDKLACLTFDIIETTTMLSNNKEGQIGLLSKCSLCKTNICQDCPINKEFYGCSISL